MALTFEELLLRINQMLTETRFQPALINGVELRAIYLREEERVALKQGGQYSRDIQNAALQLKQMLGAHNWTTCAIGFYNGVVLLDPTILARYQRVPRFMGDGL